VHWELDLIVRNHATKVDAISDGIECPKAYVRNHWELINSILVVNAKSDG
jgi:hypothetical protein